MIIDPWHLYKMETGSVPVDEFEYEFTIFRSKGQWVVEISDEEKFNIWGNQGNIEITKPDRDYVRWLEEKVMELLTQNNKL